MNPPFLLGVFIPFAAFNVFQNCSRALPEKTVSDKFHSKAWFFFWAYRREWDRNEISAYSIFKTGERRHRNNKKSINQYFSTLLLSLSQLSSSSIQAMRILSPFPHHAAACPSSPLHPASLLTAAERGTHSTGMQRSFTQQIRLCSGRTSSAIKPAAPRLLEPTLSSPRVSPPEIRLTALLAQQNRWRL